jgi:hypothetical protein
MAKMGIENTGKFLADLDAILDDDLVGVRQEGDIRLEIVILTQILRELKKEGPEEKSHPVSGFRAGTDASEPHHPF